MSASRTKQAAFLMLLALCTLPVVSTSQALMAGILFSLVLGNPWPKQSSAWSKKLLQISVVGLGFGMTLSEVWTVGKSSFLYTVLGIALTLASGTLLGRWLHVRKKTSALISFGTAICGGSAIAALAPVIGADDDEIAVSLAAVFTLNAVALLLFPLVGHFFELSQQQFGLWAALAIHDTSSVVGASSNYGTTALAVGTTVKLTRAMWIAPLVMLVALFMQSDKKAKLPLFIIGFISTAIIRSLLPQYEEIWSTLASIARQSLVVTLFLIGSGLSKLVLKHIGFNPMLQGVVLWLLVSGLTLTALLNGWIG